MSVDRRSISDEGELLSQMESLIDGWTSIPIGSIVRIKELVAKTELNGRLGTVVGYAHGQQRIKVKGDNFSVAVRPCNLEIYPASTTPIENKTQRDYQIGSNLTIYSHQVLFYPFGNTPAKNLLKNVPNSLRNNRILLLGCGDTRHIWFTCWSRSMPKAMQNLDFTACDMEPSIIARNVILYKLLLDNNDPKVTWSLFYGRMIDNHCLHTLKNCADDLLSIGSTLDQWNQSSFGQKIQFCDEISLKRVRSILILYSKGKLSPEIQKRKKIEREILVNTVFGKNGVSMDHIMHLHPCMSVATSSFDVLHKISSEYIKNGVLPNSVLNLSGKF